MPVLCLDLIYVLGCAGSGVLRKQHFLGGHMSLHTLTIRRRRRRRNKKLFVFKLERSLVCSWFALGPYIYKLRREREREREI
jgi:hypothetical protein